MDGLCLNSSPTFCASCPSTMVPCKVKASKLSLPNIDLAVFVFPLLSQNPFDQLFFFSLSEKKRKRKEGSNVSSWYCLQTQSLSEKTVKEAWTNPGSSQAAAAPVSESSTLSEKEGEFFVEIEDKKEPETKQPAGTSSASKKPPPKEFKARKTQGSVMDHVMGGINSLDVNGPNNELQIIRRSYRSLARSFHDSWTQEGDAFRTIWHQLDDDWRQRTCTRARKLLLTLAHGGYQSAVLYCPELDPSALSILPSSRSSSSSSYPPSLPTLSFVELVEMAIECARPVWEETGEAKTHTQIDDEVEQSISNKDPFFPTLNTKLEKMSKGDMKALIVVSRHHALCVFSFLVFAEVLAKGIRFVTDRIPGCQEEASSPSVPQDPSSIPPEKLEEIYANPLINTVRPTPQSPSSSSDSTTSSSSSSPASEKPVVVEEPKKGRRCSYVLCQKREGEKEKYQVCSFCRKAGKSVPYCSRQCQTDDWRDGHQDICGKHLLIKKEAQEKAKAQVESQANPDASIAPSDDKNQKLY